MTSPESTPIPAGSPTEAVVKLAFAHAYVLGELSPVIDVKDEAELLVDLARQALPDFDLGDLLLSAFERGRQKTIRCNEGDEVPN